VRERFGVGMEYLWLIYGVSSLKVNLRAKIKNILIINRKPPAQCRGLCYKALY
jgi:hypothetical protein